MTHTTYTEVWDLESFFEGGSQSQTFQNYLEKIGILMQEFTSLANDMQITENEEHTINSIGQVLRSSEEVFKKLMQASAFVSCLKAENTVDPLVERLQMQVMQQSSTFSTALLTFQNKLTLIGNDEWKQYVSSETLTPVAFVLDEWRQMAQEKLSIQEEDLIQSLSMDGFHSWGELYHTTVSMITIPYEDENGQTTLSVGQANNIMGQSNAALREKVFNQMEQAWEEKSPIFAKALNHIAGYRLMANKKRGWNSPLKEPLLNNRMKEETLHSMWAAVEKYKEPVTRYLERKAKLLGVNKLSWFDLDAPIGEVDTKKDFTAGAKFIIEQFGTFSPLMKTFAEQAFEGRWIEAENRPNKRPGGFHTYFADSGQSRIFMTYSGTPSNVSTLAHELGHGFHSFVMKDIPFFNRKYAMNVAETASTFAELIVADASVRQAETKMEKVVLLDDKISRTVTMFMNIHARYLFETAFYEERKKGTVTRERLNELMTSAQKQAYGHSLEHYHPYFWASKLHFYNTHTPFYQFPYTFGYLFSLGIYKQAQEVGPSYEKKYLNLLKDTGSMTVESLAMKHLNEDLTKPDFWENAASLCIKDIEEFMQLTTSL